MTPLQQKMAEFGFESNESYDYHLQCLLNSQEQVIRTLNVDGDCGRRKTAFASALARAMDYPHLLYYDFTQQSEAEGKVQLPRSEDEQGLEEEPISDFDHIMSEACAFSEGEKTILILDQLQVADFKDHIRLYHFIKYFEWQYRDVTLRGNPQNLIIMLISESPLYHSLQKVSFRVWIDSKSHKQVDYQPQEFGLDDDIRPVMEALAEVFKALEMAPTKSEYEKILRDVHLTIRTSEHLQHSIYGWMEGIDRSVLFSDEIEPILQQAAEEIQRYHGMDIVEL